MKLTWHIVAKDLRRLQLPLAIWIAMFVAEFAIGARILTIGASSASAFQRYQYVATVLAGLRAVLGYLLVPALVLEDVLVDTKAFWPTRPISGGRLLGAKLLECLLLFGLLPIVVTLPWWLFCGYGAHEVYEASLDSLGSQVIPVAAGLMIASLVGTFSRFIGWALLTAAAVLLSFLTLVTPAGTHLFLHGMDVLAGAEVNVARLHLVNWVAIVACLAVVVHQFLTRRLARSLVILGCILGLLAVEVTWWPVEFRGRPEISAVAAPQAPLDSRITIQSTEGPMLHIEGDSSDSSDGWVFGSLNVQNIPSDLNLKFQAPIFEWRWPDGHVLRQQGTLVGGMWQSLYQNRMAAPHRDLPESEWERSSLYKLSLKNGHPLTYEKYMETARSPKSHSFDYYVAVPRQEGLRMLSEPPSCTLELRGEVLRRKLGAEIPLVPGSTWKGKTENLRVALAAWNEKSGMMHVLLVSRRAAVGEIHPSPPNPFGYSTWFAPDSVFVAINRRTGESAWPVAGSYAEAVSIATVGIEWRAMTFVGPYDPEFGSPYWENGKRTGPSQKDWFTDATLGRVTDAVDGSFSRNVAFDKFTVSLDGFSKAP